MNRLIVFLVLAAEVCIAQTATVANAIGSRSSRINTIAPAMLATLTQSGSDLSVGVTTGVLGAVPAPEPTALIQNILIRPAGSTTTIPVNILSATSGAATFIVPAAVPYGGAEILFQVRGVYQTTNVNVTQSNFELAAKTQVAANGLFTDIGLASPARPGQTVFLTGSGLGYGSQVTATVGGLPATVIYAGRNGARPGYDQIQLQLPSGIPDSCFTPLALTVNSAVVNSSLSVTSDGSPCPHPFQLSTSDLKNLDSGGWLATGQIAMQSDLQATLDTAASRSESVSFNPAESNLASFPMSAPLSSPACTDVTSLQAYAVPVLVVRNGDFSFPVGDPPPPIPDFGKSLSLQNGGTVLTLPNTNGSFSATPPRSPEASLANLPPSALMPGKWTWSSPGSADLDASAFTFSLPAPLRLSAVPVPFRRDQDQKISWNGADFAPLSGTPSVVTISLRGRGADGITPRVVSCSAPAAAGSLTIPLALISPFAPSTLGTLVARFSPSLDSLPHTLLKTKKGDTLLLYTTYSSSDSRPVDFR